MIAIAIDGPAAAGKSTIARRVAARFGYLYVDTGALYRAIGLYALEKGADTADEQTVVSFLPEIELTLRHNEQGQRVLLGDRDVSEDIRRPEMSMAASNVSAFPAVRSFLLSLQRRLAEQNNVVMDGRDIGTVVLPAAQVKIFLTASAQVRAHRRQAEYEQKGLHVDFDVLLDETVRRDQNDMNRAQAPLRQAEDAVLVDNGDLTLEQTVERILQIAREKL
jgi:cytidylate kinase